MSNNFSIQPETDFQNMVDHEYSGKDRTIPEFPNGLFGSVPGSRGPAWTPNQLIKELMREAINQSDQHRAEWKQDETQRLGIIQQAANNLADLINKITSKEYMNAPQEWLDWVEANKKA